MSPSGCILILLLFSFALSTPVQMQEEGDFNLGNSSNRLFFKICHSFPGSRNSILSYGLPFRTSARGLRNCWPVKKVCFEEDMDAYDDDNQRASGQNEKAISCIYTRIPECLECTNDSACSDNQLCSEGYCMDKTTTGASTCLRGKYILRESLYLSNIQVETPPLQELI